MSVTHSTRSHDPHSENGAQSQRPWCLPRRAKNHNAQDASRILFLGTMASPASRSQGFFYMHPRNRFWPVMEALFAERDAQHRGDLGDVHEADRHTDDGPQGDESEDPVTEPVAREAGEREQEQSPHAWKLVGSSHGTTRTTLRQSRSC